MVRAVEKRGGKAAARYFQTSINTVRKWRRRWRNSALCHPGGGMAVSDKLSRRPILQREQLRRLRKDKQYDYLHATRELGYAPRSFNDGACVLI
jgi:transposase-like protein